MQRQHVLRDLPKDALDGFNAVFNPLSDSVVPHHEDAENLVDAEFLNQFCNDSIIPEYLLMDEAWREKSLAALIYFSNVEFPIVEKLWNSILPPFGLDEERYSEFFLEIHKKLSKIEI